MADGPADNPDGGIGARAPADWRNLWQMPAIVGSLALIVLALRIGLKPEHVPNFAEHLGLAERLIEDGDYDAARVQLQEVVEPRLAEATGLERGMFHRAVADWVALAGRDSAANHQLVIDQYRLARDLGATLAPAQLGRIAMAQVALGRLPDAKTTLDEIDDLLRGVMATEGADAEPLRRVRNRVLQQVVHATVERGGLPLAASLEVLERFRADPLVGVAEAAWAVATAARLRTAAGDAEDAAARLTVEMRRLEDAAEPLPPEAWGRLYVALAAAYVAAGRDADAAYHLDEAFARFDAADRRGDDARGEAVFLRGRLLVARGSYDEALDAFDEVVGGYAGTDAFLSALLARAEVRSILGRHDEALADFVAVVEAIVERRPRDPDPGLVAERLVDRNLSALAAGEVALALEYLAPAESLLAVLAERGASVHDDVLLRLAATHEQVARNLVGGVEGADPQDVDWDALDVAVRREAIAQFAAAADAYERHVRALQDAPGTEADWGRSLRIAAECRDLSGRPDLAADRLREYLAQFTAMDDPWQPEVRLALAQALEAQMLWSDAADEYARIIDQHPNSAQATASHVPLSRCLMAMSDDAAQARLVADDDAAVRRLDEEVESLRRRAVGVLEEVIDGRRDAAEAITPDAPDYRDALVALGTLHHRLGVEAVARRDAAERELAAARDGTQGARVGEALAVEQRTAFDELQAAVERLDTAVRRYADGRSIVGLPAEHEVRFRLADAHRVLADLLERDLERRAAVAPSERHEIRERVRGHRVAAIDGFGLVCDGYASLPPERLTRLQREFRRQAWMSRGDCAYLLERWSEAANVYERAARLLGDDDLALHALVQIVDCYERLGDERQAEIAHLNARARLRRMPAEAFGAPQSLLRREAWERWLKRRPAGALAAEPSE